MLDFRDALRRTQSLAGQTRGPLLPLVALAGLQTALLASLGASVAAPALLLGLGAAAGVLLRLGQQLAADLLFQSRSRAELLGAYDRVFAAGRGLLARQSPADLLQRIGADLPAFFEARFYAKLELASGAVSFAVGMFALALSEPSKAGPVLAAGTGAALLAQGARRLLRRLAEERSRLSAETFRKEKNLVDGMDYLLVSRRYGSLREELSGLLRGKEKIARRFALVDNLVSTSHWGARYLVVLGFASILAFPAGFDPKSIFWLYLALGCASQAGWGWQKLRLAEAHLARAAELLAPAPDQDRRASGANASLRARGLEISFDPRRIGARPDLGPFDFSWRAGDRVWIEGRSGAGKTTLLRALSGLHPSWCGTIEAPPAIGFVPQSPFFFDGESLAYNLGGGNLDHDLLGALGLAPFFASLPDGERTILGAEGVNPSRGQRLRLAVYRELLRRPSLLLLDEPLAGLDRQVAAALMKTCRAWMADGILCVCDHRADARALLEPTHFISLDAPREDAWNSASC